MSEELITTTEFAELAGVGLSTVVGWRDRFEDFPAIAEHPNPTHHRTRYYRRSAAERFLRQHRLGKDYAEGGEVRRGPRPRQDGGSRFVHAASSAAMANTLAELDIAFTIVVADRDDPSERAHLERIASLGSRLFSTPMMNSRMAAEVRRKGQPLIDEVVSLGHAVSVREPSLGELVFNPSRFESAPRPAVDASDLHDMFRRSDADRPVDAEVLSRRAIDSFERTCRNFRRSPNPWTRRPLDNENAIAKLLPALMPDRPRTYVDLTCGIGAATIAAYRRGCSVIGFDRNAADVRAARQWALVLARANAERGPSAAFHVRDQLSSAEFAKADMVVLSEPSSDSDLIFRDADRNAMESIDLRLAFARSRTRIDGRTLLVLPTHLLDPSADRDDAGSDIRESWIDGLEAVLEVPERETALATSILILRAKDAPAPRGPVLFATLPLGHRNENELRDLLGLVWHGAGALADFDPAFVRNAALAPRGAVRQAGGILAPGYWWRRDFAWDVERAGAVLKADCELLEEADRRLAAALGVVERRDLTATVPPEGSPHWRPMTDLVDADFLEPLAVMRRSTERSMPLNPALRAGIVPIIRPDRPISGSPFAVPEALPQPDEALELQRDDVVFWQRADGSTAVRVIDGADRALLISPGRGFRITRSGHRAGLTAELVAFFIELGGLTVERASSRRASGTFRFPTEHRHQDIHDAIIWATDKFGDAAEITAAYLEVEVQAAELAIRAAEFRRDATLLGGSQATLLQTYYRRN